MPDHQLMKTEREPIAWRPNLLAFGVLAGLAGIFATGCVSHQVHNPDPSQYIQQVASATHGGASGHLAIIEFDDHGVLWQGDQLEDAIELISQENASSQTGLIVVVYVHGWKNDANPTSTNGALSRFKKSIVSTAAAQRASGGLRADRVVGVFLGWRGASSDWPFFEQLTFWDRRQTAERLASINMREALFRIMLATKQREGSKCFVVGHSMGGLIVGKTFAPALTTLLLSNQQRDSRLFVDLVLLQNPALDGLASWQLVDFLKRADARLHLRTTDGSTIPADGPLIASITSEADRATGRAYPFGRRISNLLTAFRHDHVSGAPTQRHLATHAEGHVDYLVSHRAYLDDGRLVLERVPGAFNDTPFWIIRVSSDISKDHGDVNNPVYAQLVEKLINLNKVYRPDLSTWMTSYGFSSDGAAYESETATPLKNRH